MVKLRKKKINDGQFSLYLDIYLNGKRRYEFLKLYITSDRIVNKETIRLAETIRAKRQIEIQSERFGFVPEHKSRICFIEYIKYSVKDKKIRTIRMAQSNVKHITQFSKSILLNEVNEQWLQDYENFISSRISNNSVVNYMNSLKTTLYRAVREKIISVNPFIYFIPKIRKKDVKKEFLTYEELTKLAGTYCKVPELKRAFLFACYTGLRISDIVNLKWNNVKNDSIEFIMKKTNSNHQIPLSESAKLILFRENAKILELNNEARVFKLPCISEMLRYIRDWVKEAKIDKHITTHCARHTFATLALTHGVDLYTVSKLLGHTDIKTTQIYAKIIDAKKVEAVNRLPEIMIA